MTIVKSEPDWPELFEWARPSRLLDWLRGPETSLGERTMRVEEFVDGDQLVIRAEMPGIDPDKDVQVNVSGHVLHIHAERREETKAEEKGTYRSEFHYGSFTRTLALPAEAKEGDVKATYKDGILEVRLPVDRKAAAATKIPVHRV